MKRKTIQLIKSAATQAQVTRIRLIDRLIEVNPTDTDAIRALQKEAASLQSTRISV